MTRALALAALLAVGAILIALIIGIAGPLVALAAAAALIGAVLILADTHWGFVALCAVAFLLPFASLPFSVGFKPTFLDVALAALFFVWLFKLVIGQQRDFVASPLGLLVGLFMILALFSFALGLTHSPANTFLVRRFLEILIGVSLFFVTINTVRTQAELVWVTRWVIAGGVGRGADRHRLLRAAAGRDGGDPRPAGALRLSGRVRRAALHRGRPCRNDARHRHGGGPQRAGGNGDPGGGPAAAAVGGAGDGVPRWLTVLMFGCAVGALYLTYSRSALLGLAAALALLAVLKYRKLIPLAIGAALLLLLLPITQEYVARLVAGFAGEDLATQMRFGEYKDALILINRYPLFGVGFTGTPDLDIYLGVSMLYLIMAENMGIVGLAVFVAILVGFFVLVGQAWRRGVGPSLEPLLLGYTGAILGALVSGIFDHYWFNMTYPHMTVLFWLYMGLATATVLIVRQGEGT